MTKKKKKDLDVLAVLTKQRRHEYMGKIQIRMGAGKGRE